MITFHNEDVSLPEEISDNAKFWINEVINQYDYLLDNLTYIFCSDEHILKINTNYLDHNYYTDIITFDYCKGKRISGDLFISIDTVKSNSQKYNCNYNDELHRVMIHGVLHLLGFKDASEQEKLIMRKREDDALSLLATFH
ncbi:rRNA maturation RNase YbeY [Carboxylicivirga sediminis]|uniref:Endoribonuclease YbeY n=1 Tax=Carboxylicivirga sediminis TaxID=2006564 RepID=A0A941F5N1_9BACT|nr:rRNA maturation RNase YbeY [Carboxylicivirga sediminis]MBR8537281.1 rRNA maturation RNase YbeY [Carboxylicivirga sediminis]